MLRDWARPRGYSTRTPAWFASPAELVVEQVATWRGSDGEATDPQTVASSFTVADGLVKRTVRYGSLTEALAATGLTLLDEVSSTAS